jgi:hypothetical protein
MKIEKGRVLLAAGLLFLGFAFSGEQAVSQYKKDVQIRYFDGTSASGQSIGQMEKTEETRDPEGIPAVAAWNAERNIKVENPDLPFDDRVLCIIVKGDKEQVIKDPLLEGGYGYRDDEEACIISKGTAWKLFGSTHVVGKYVICKGKNWVIRGVADSNDSYVILTAGRLKLMGYQNLSFSYRDRDRIQGKTEELMMRYSVSNDGVMIDGSFYHGAARLAFSFPFWILLFVICRTLAVTGKRKKFPGYRIIMIILAAAGTVILIKWSFCFPQEFIPSKWSDFGFWTEKFQSVKENINQIAQLPKSLIDVRIVRTFYQCIINSAVSGCFFLANFGCRRYAIG